MAKKTQLQKIIGKEITHMKEGKKGHMSKEQALAIAFSKARKEGIRVPVKKKKK